MYMNSTSNRTFKQTLKFSISSTCYSLNIPVKWSSVYKYITSSYNCYVHETTGIFHSHDVLKLGRRFFRKTVWQDDLNNYLYEIDDFIESNRDDVNDNIIYHSCNIDDFKIIRYQAIYNGDIDSERMIRRCIWPNDTTHF
ncbi:hypothetical protein DMUE_1140 [Dictyocoela muelleri]|nr:hypothetical protein DMUE_1140 [Dictyocoela muelleri]